MPRLTADYGVILAGGRALRMGGQDKPLLELEGRSLIQWVVESARPQVRELMLCVNHNPGKYAHLGLQQFSDYDRQYSGPLVGIVSAMKQISTMNKPESETLLACFPADAPFFPHDIVENLIQVLQDSGTDMSLVQTGEQQQPLFSVWKLSLLPTLEKAVEEGLAGPRMVMPRLRHSILQREAKANEFMNINTPDDLSTARLSWVQRR